MKLILVDPNVQLCTAFEEFFGTLPDVEIVNGVFEQLPAFDCIANAGNSFGLMDGGVDAAITRFFGASLMRTVQDYILSEFLGEQPVGTSFIVETRHATHPYLAHTPTMRVPMAIAHTDNVYNAMAAALRAVWLHNRSAADKPIETLACPGLGTGAGYVPFRESARQMALAYSHFLRPPQYINWTLAEQRQSAIRYGGDVGFDFPPAQ